MEKTTERMIPERDKGGTVYLEHMAHYIFASQFVKGKIVLDIASGTGYGAHYLARKGAKKVVGVDNSSQAIEYSHKLYSAENVEFMIGDARKIPSGINTFDVVVSFETIEHFNEQEAFIREVKRVLKKDGILIISTPNSYVYPPGNIWHVILVMCQ